jgi:hypothetical protein
MKFMFPACRTGSFTKASYYDVRRVSFKKFIQNMSCHLQVNDSFLSFTFLPFSHIFRQWQFLSQVNQVVTVKIWLKQVTKVNEGDKNEKKALLELYQLAKQPMLTMPNGMCSWSMLRVDWIAGLPTTAAGLDMLQSSREPCGPPVGQGHCCPYPCNCFNQSVIGSQAISHSDRVTGDQ